MISRMESALAAFRHGDNQPLCQALGMFPLPGDCEDCGRNTVLKPHGKSVVCDECYQDRETFLNEVLS